MYTNVIFPRQWSRLACLCRSASSIEGQKLPQASASSDGISPPARIPRGPTDILQALAATVGPDPTAAHYKYHDDPYLIPLSNYHKRSYALAAEAGRKAAVWIRDEHADLFTTRIWDPPLRMKTPHFNADPHIDAFAPKPIYTDESKVTEEDLQYTIKNALLDDAIKVFQLLGGAEGVSEEMKVQFLQLLCFYNEKEPLSADWVAERWFSASNTRDRPVASWRVGGLADVIFTSMEPKTPEAYCAIIQGMAKYYQAERAYALFQEAIEKGIPLSTGVYNSLLGCIGFLREGYAFRIDALKHLLAQMEEQGLSPNQETLTASLRSVAAWGHGAALMQLALQLVAEFRRLGIEPGLSAYYYLLCHFCRENGPRVDILTTILNDLEQRDNINATQATDTHFFITAMGVCSDHLQDINLAERVHALLMKDDNYKLVGDAYKESIYYRHYVTVACRHAPFEKTVQLLDMLVPNIYVPEPSVMEEIIRTLELGGAGDRLAGAWSQIVAFGQTNRVILVERLLSAMCNVYQYQDEEVKAKMREAAADTLKFGQMSAEREKSMDQRSPSTMKLSASAMCNIIELCSDVTEQNDPCWESVAAAINKLKLDQAPGVPSNPQVIVDVATKAAAYGKHGIAADAVQYLSEYGFDEALSAGTQTLALMLNRTPEEAQALLDSPSAELEGSLQPAALAVVKAYQLSKSAGATVHTSADSSTSSYDSESSDDELSDDESSDDE